MDCFGISVSSERLDASTRRRLRSSSRLVSGLESPLLARGVHACRFYWMVVDVLSALLDALFAARSAWSRAHQHDWPTRVYLSPRATQRVLRATCGVSAVAPVLIDHGDSGGQVWTVKQFAADVLGMTWFEDTRLKDEEYRFEL